MKIVLDEVKNFIGDVGNFWASNQDKLKAPYKIPAYQKQIKNLVEISSLGNKEHLVNLTPRKLKNIDSAISKITIPGKYLPELEELQISLAQLSSILMRLDI